MNIFSEEDQFEEHKILIFSLLNKIALVVDYLQSYSFQ